MIIVFKKQGCAVSFVIRLLPLAWQVLLTTRQAKD